MSQRNIAICQWCAPSAGSDVCRFAAEAGVNGVELDIGPLDQGMPMTDPAVQAQYLREAETHGIRFPSLALNVFGEYTMLTPWSDPRSEVTRNILKSGVMTAAAMGIPLLQVPSFGGNTIKNREDMIITAEYLRYTARLAQKFRITIGAENTLNAEENRILLDMVGEPNCKVYFDNENMVFFRQQDPVDMIRTLGKDLCELHLKDGTEDTLSCRPLGEGNARAAECAEALLEIGYKGWLVLENDYTGENSVESVKRDVAFLRQAGL
ncbi:MAG: sugar phosphate isomerase/epimerase [Clostridia bacterium]|nr:sugar phosphate isomerase/epimerase [Clostridia bacterium]